MLDYQRIVDDVRSSLGSADGDELDFLCAAAADYSVACDEVNERLHQCGSLLRQGLRSEAIQLADTEPNLLDLVALLDFPEREQWSESVRQHGLAAPATLLLDIAAGLNEAYALEQPLATVLRDHRLLALSKGPLPARIAVLRRLAEMDRDNTIWLEDLQPFEHERQRQLRVEAEAAIRASNAIALASLCTELTSPEWRHPPADELVQSVVESQRRLHFWSVQHTFERLSEELLAAKTRYKVDVARALREQWHRTIGESQLQPSDHLALQAAPALEWLEAQDELELRRQEHQAALGVLAAAVDNERSPSQLEEHYFAATRLGSIPADLEKRYQATFAVLARTALRRRLLVLAGLLATAAGLFAVGGMIASHQRRERQITDAVETIDKLVRQEEFERAESFANGLAPEIQQDPRVKEPLAALPAALEKETNRAKAFANELDTARYKVAEVNKALDANPLPAVFNGLLDELDAATVHLESARQKARTENEQKSLAAAKESAGDAKNRWQQSRDQAFLAQCKSLDERLSEIEHDSSGAPAVAAVKLDECRNELEKLKSKSADASPAVAAQVAALGARLETLAKVLKVDIEKMRDAKKLSSAVGKIPEYLQELKDYATKYPMTDRAADFKKVGEESLCWQAVHDWNTLAAALHAHGLRSISAKEATELLALAQPLSDTFADSAEGETLHGVEPYLKAVAARDGNGEPIVTSLKKLFNDPLLSEAWVIEVPGDRQPVRYYVTGAEEPSPSESFRYATGWEERKVKQLTMSDAQSATVSRAPQVSLAEKVKPLLNRLDDANWEDSFYRILVAIHNDDGMDPILKADLLHEVLAVGRRGSHVLEKAWGDHQRWFTEQKIDFQANWFDPFDRAADSARSEARGKLSGFPSLDAVAGKVKRDLEFLQHYRLPSYRWVGWLCRTPNRCWQCAAPEEAVKGTGPLFVVRRPEPTGKPRFDKLGLLDGGVVTIDAAASALCLEGRPIYLKTP
jgi:hypothetical protein